MRTIRVLVVDDSAVARRVISRALSNDPSIEVAGTAADGSSALSRVESLGPDLVTLDLEMPGMSGLEVLAELLARHPELPVIMVSALTTEGASATLEALTLGARDYVTKPSQMQSQDAAMTAMHESLVPRVKALCAATRPRRVRHHGNASAPRVDIVAIGVSTGGPNALAELIPRLPAALAAPIVIVQHMPPAFTAALAQRLDGLNGLDVREGEAGALLEAGQVWIAPGAYHMTVEPTGTWRDGMQLALDQEAPEHACRPAADRLFRSVAQHYGEHALAIVLTGMGQDGTSGCREICDRGGRVVVQDQATSVVWGMPGSVEHAGCCHAVLPLQEIPEEIIRCVAAQRNFAAPPRRDDASAGSGS